MKFSQLLLVVILSCAVAFGTSYYFNMHQSAAPVQAGAKEAAYDRVMRTQTLRCGYIPYSYQFIVDPNTKQMSGVMYDIMNEIGRLAKIKIEWAEELTWATLSTAIENGRVDAFCSGMWIDTQNGKFLAFSTPLYFNGIGIYGRVDETRFAKLEDLDNSSVRVVSRDGGTPGIIAQHDFPKATIVSLPSGVSDGEMLEQIFTNKADVIFFGDDYLMDFINKNPGKLKPILPETKLRVYATAIALPINDPALKNMIDNTVVELKGSKIPEKILEKYAPPGSWMTGYTQ